MTARPFGVETGVALPLLLDNVDTDQIIPSREMKTVGRAGLGAGLFAGWRYTDGQRTPDPAFVLNQPQYAGASVLLSGANFGCGSSREHAVWALAEFGVRAILAESFGEIFHTNCLRNGVLPVSLAREEIEAFAAHVAADPQGRKAVIDLSAQTVRFLGLAREARFSIEPFAKRLLLEGLDPIGLTLKEAPAIEAHLSADRALRPWLYS